MSIQNDNEYRKVRAALQAGKWKEDPQFQSAMLNEAQSYADANFFVPPKDVPQQEFGNPRAASGEATLSMLASAALAVPSGIAGLFSALPGGRTPAEAVEDVQGLAFQPRTKLGQAALEQGSKPFELFERGADIAGEFVDPVLGPIGSTAVKTGILGAPALLGLRGVKPRPPTRRQRIARKAQQDGYVIDPASTNTGATAGAIEGFGGKIKTQQLAAQRNQAVTDAKANRALGLPEENILSPEGLSALRRQEAASYEALRGSGEVAADTIYRRDLANATSRFRTPARDFKTAEQASKKLLKTAEDLNRQSFDAASAVDMMQLLRDRAEVAWRAGKKSESKAWRHLSNALEGAVERDLARRGQVDLVENFRASRQRIAKSYSVESALEGSNVSATKLAAQLKKGKPLSGELREIAEFAQEFPKITRAFLGKEAITNFSPLDLGIQGLSFGGAGLATALGAPGLGTAAVALPFLLSFARPALRSLALGGPGQALARSTGTQTGAAIPGLLGSGALADESLLGTDTLENKGLLTQ